MTYTAHIHCQNCKHEAGGILGVEIPLGKRIDEYMKETKCERCGCTLK